MMSWSIAADLDFLIALFFAEAYGTEYLRELLKPMLDKVLTDSEKLLEMDPRHAIGSNNGTCCAADACSLSLSALVLLLLFIYFCF